MSEYDKESLRIYLSYHVSELRGLHYQVVNRWHEGQAIYGRKRGTFMKCVICEQEHEKEGLEYCVAALVRRNLELERKYADWRDHGTASAECSKCENRGKLNGLSQETYCSGCIHADQWKKDYFSPLS